LNSCYSFIIKAEYQSVDIGWNELDKEILSDESYHSGIGEGLNVFGHVEIHIIVR
jgi:hypothetical protein